MNIKPLRRQVLIELDSPDSHTASGLIVPDAAQAQKSDRGIVRALGTDKKKPFDFKVGDHVVVSKYGTMYKHGSKTFKMVDAENVLAVLS